jgi:hypothetical protein
MYLFHYKGNVLVEPVKVTHAVSQFDIIGLDTVQVPFQNGSFTFSSPVSTFWGFVGGVEVYE